MRDRAHLIELVRQYDPLDEMDAAEAAKLESFLLSTPNCFERSNSDGHVTAGAWVIDCDADAVLLTLHRKLGIWIQLGGHADGEPDILAVAEREAFEESGLQQLNCFSEAIFDLGIHRIPRWNDVPEHFHYDIRFAFTVAGSRELTVSNESIDLRWIPLDQLESFTREPSLLRMRQKWRRITA